MVHSSIPYDNVCLINDYWQPVLIVYEQGEQKRPLYFFYSPFFVSVGYDLEPFWTWFTFFYHTEKSFVRHTTTYSRPK